MSEVLRKPSQSTRDYDASFERLLKLMRQPRCLRFTRKLFSAWPARRSSRYPNWQALEISCLRIERMDERHRHA